MGGAFGGVHPDRDAELGRGQDVDRHARLVGKVGMAGHLDGRLAGVEHSEHDDLVGLASHDPLQPGILSGEATADRLDQVAGHGLLIGGPLRSRDRHRCSWGSKSSWACPTLWARPNALAGAVPAARRSSTV